MKLKIPFLYVLAAAGLLAVSCTGSGPVPETVSEKEEVGSEPEKNYSVITNSYSLEELLVPLVQLNNIFMSMDYFDQFLSMDDYIFPEYLLLILGMEKSDYEEGQTAVLSSPEGWEGPPMAVEKGLISEDSDGSSWWILSVEFSGISRYLEIQTNKYRVPMKIRFADPYSGAPSEAVPGMAGEFERAAEELPEAQLAESINEDIRRKTEEGKTYLLNSPRVIGEELISVPAGEFMTVHLRDVMSEDRWVDYWMSPDVPGSIVRVAHGDASGTVTVSMELHDLKTGVERKFRDDEVVPAQGDSFGSDGGTGYGAGFSEGSPENPVSVFPDEIYYGSVGDGEVSYYKFTMDRRADLYIQIDGMEGFSELYYFGGDPSFSDWVTASEGASLNVEDYYLEEGTEVYFTVNDIQDEYSVGEFFSISVTQEIFLDPLGIMLKGNIYNEAAELKAGEVHTLSAGSDGLDYYKTVSEEGGTLVIEVKNEPEFSELKWFDTAGGSYSGVSSGGYTGEKKITVTGLSPGTVCYYYLVSDPAMIDPLQKLVLEISSE